MLKKSSFEHIDEVIQATYNAIKIPFYFMYVLLVGVSSVMVSIAILNGWLLLPPFLILVTPVGLLLIGVTLRKIKHAWFFDLPGIIMPSIGLGMIGLMAYFG